MFAQTRTISYLINIFSYLRYLFIYIYYYWPKNYPTRTRTSTSQERKGFYVNNGKRRGWWIWGGWQTFGLRVANRQRLRCSKKDVFSKTTLYWDDVSTKRIRRPILSSNNNWDQIYIRRLRSIWLRHQISLPKSRQ